jgi:hypothetical protein
MTRAVTKIALCFLVGLTSTIGLTSCGSSSEPITSDIYVDSTFSNDQVAADCFPDVMRAIRTTAASHGVVSFHTFDGDPLRRRGTSAAFSEDDIPRDLRGTSGEDEYLESLSEGELEEEIEALIAEPPEVYGTPLLLVLSRAAQFQEDDGGEGNHRILICTDGLFGDVRPGEMTEEEASERGANLAPGLKGATVDFIGLDVSAPGSGRRIAQTRALVRAVLSGAEAHFGTWNAELPPIWP